MNYFTFIKKKIFKEEGFSVIEILIAVLILGILSAVILGSFSGFRNTQVLQNETSNVLSVISGAKSNSISSLNLMSYGVYFDEDRVVVFVGDTYDENNEDNQTFLLNDAVFISDINITNEEQEVVFDRLSGGVENFGEITISVSSDLSKSRTITITETGMISSN